MFLFPIKYWDIGKQIIRHSVSVSSAVAAAWKQKCDVFIEYEYKNAW